MLQRLRSGVVDYAAQWRRFNRNVRLGMVSAMFGGIAQGAFTVAFNLYVIALGIKTDVLGKILSASPLAHAIGSIPAGFIAEIIGFKQAFASIYALTGLGQVAQVATGDPLLIALGAFVAGLAFTGSFVVRQPFLAENTTAAERTYVYSASSILQSISSALGSLLAGFGPTLLRPLVPDIATAYRYTLYVAAAFGALALVPNAFLKATAPRERKQISLAPYLWGMDRFTVQNAIIALLMGLAMGLIGPFINIYFVSHLGTSREFFGTVSALTLFPAIIALSMGPALARSLGRVRAVTALHLLAPVFILTLAITKQPWLGTLAFWGYRILFVMAPAILISFMMQASTPKAKVAASAWHNGSFWLGNAISAPITGYLLARSDYATPAYLASAAAIALAICNQFFFASIERRLTASSSAAPSATSRP